jgi:hypothetical protein
MAQDAPSVLAAVSAKRLVFTATAGRTGTAYVTVLFKGLRDTHAEHEPEPNFVHVMRRAQEHAPIALDFLLRHKLPAIAARPGAAYVELSHLACKGFLEPMLALGLRPSLLVLRRGPRSIAKSLLERATVPGRTSAGWLYLLQPGDPMTLPLPGHATMTDYQLCFWYALEIERRQARYAQLFARAGCRVAEASARGLNDAGVWRGVVAALGFDDLLADDADARHAAATARTWNANPSRPASAIDYETQEDGVWKAILPYEPLLRAEIALREGA